jgi:outer membrane protein assembly factor BamB
VYSPVVHADLVAASFTTFGAQPSGGVVVAGARTGRLGWQRQVPGSTGASGNPAFAGDLLLVASRDGTIHGFDRVSGEVVWELPRVEHLGDEQDYRPLATSGRVVVAGSLSGQVVAYDTITRRELWRRTPLFASVAFAIAAHDGVVYVPYFSNRLVALRLRDGAELWRLGGGASQFRWPPLVDGPYLFASGTQVLSAFRHDGLRGRLE